jgi:uncharacterized damage-inducible protein DinB
MFSNNVCFILQNYIIFTLNKKINFMYRKVEDFLTDWKYESEQTLGYFRNIPDNILANKDNENVRTIARLSWHITITLSEMLNKTGLEIDGPDDHAAPPSTMKEIIETYEKLSSEILKQVEENWVDASLTEKIEMYGELWTKGSTLAILIRHQAHHRGQLSILMRQNGCKVPGVYGPSKEEWATYHMPAME